MLCVQMYTCNGAQRQRPGAELVQITEVSLCGTTQTWEAPLKAPHPSTGIMSSCSLTELLQYNVLHDSALNKLNIHLHTLHGFWPILSVDFY